MGTGSIHNFLETEPTTKKDLSKKRQRVTTNDIIWNNCQGETHGESSIHEEEQVADKSPWKSVKFPCDPGSSPFINQPHDCLTSTRQSSFPSSFSETPIHPNFERPLCLHANTQSKSSQSQIYNVVTINETKHHEDSQFTHMNKIRHLELSSECPQKKEGQSTQRETPPTMSVSQPPSHASFSAHEYSHSFSNQSSTIFSTHASLNMIPSQSFNTDNFMVNPTHHSTIFQKDIVNSFPNSPSGSELPNDLGRISELHSQKRQMSNSPSTSATPNQAIKEVKSQNISYPYPHTCESVKPPSTCSSDMILNQDVLTSPIQSNQSSGNHKKFKTSLNMIRRNSHADLSHVAEDRNNKLGREAEMNISCPEFHMESSFIISSNSVLNDNSSGSDGTSIPSECSSSDSLQQEKMTLSSHDNSKAATDSPLERKEHGTTFNGKSSDRPNIKTKNNSAENAEGLHANPSLHVAAPAAFPTEEICISSLQSSVSSPLTTLNNIAEDKNVLKSTVSSKPLASVPSYAQTELTRKTSGSSFCQVYNQTSADCPSFFLATTQYTLPSIAPNDIVHPFASAEPFYSDPLPYTQNESIFFAQNSWAVSPASNTGVATAKTSGSFASHRSSISNTSTSIPERLYLQPENDLSRKISLWNDQQANNFAPTPALTINSDLSPCPRFSALNISTPTTTSSSNVQYPEQGKTSYSYSLLSDPATLLLPGNSGSSQYTDAFLSPASPQSASLPPWEISASHVYGHPILPNLRIQNTEGSKLDVKYPSHNSPFEQGFRNAPEETASCFAAQTAHTQEDIQYPSYLLQSGGRQQPFSTCTPPAAPPAAPPASALPPSSALKSHSYHNFQPKHNFPSSPLFFNESSQLDLAPSLCNNNSTSTGFVQASKITLIRSNVSNLSASNSNTVRVSKKDTSNSNQGVSSYLPDLSYTIRPSGSVQLLGRTHLCHYLTPAQIQSLLTKYLMYCSRQFPCHFHGCWHNYISSQQGAGQATAVDLETAAERRITRWGECKITIYTPKVAQKSYGTEKRFLCPPPLISLLGYPFFPNVHSNSGNSAPSLSENPNLVKSGLPSWLHPPSPSTLPMISLRLSDSDQTIQSERGECINLSDASWKNPFRLKTFSTRRSRSSNPHHVDYDNGDSEQEILNSEYSSTAERNCISNLSSISAASLSKDGSDSRSHNTAQKTHPFDTTNPNKNNEEESMVGIDKYCGENTCGDQVIERWIFKQIWVSDSERKKSFECVFQVPHPHFVVRSKSIKVISKPSKKKINSSNSCGTTLGAIYSNTTVSLFNRIRSQTVSTKYLTVGSTLSIPASVLGREPSYNDPLNKPFSGRVSVDPHLFTFNFVKHVFPGAVNPEQVQFLLSTSAWSNFQIVLVDEFESSSAYFSTPNALCECPQCMALRQPSTSNIERVLCYNQTVVLVDPMTGIRSKELILRKVEKSTMAIVGEGRLTFDSRQSHSVSNEDYCHGNATEAKEMDRLSYPEAIKKLRSSKEPVSIGNFHYQFEPLPLHPWMSHHSHQKASYSGSVTVPPTPTTSVDSHTKIPTSLPSIPMVPSKVLHVPSHYVHEIDSPFSTGPPDSQPSMSKPSHYFSSSHANPFHNYGTALAATEEGGDAYQSRHSFSKTSSSSSSSLTCKTISNVSHSHSSSYVYPQDPSFVDTTGVSSPTQSVSNLPSEPMSMPLPKQGPLLQLHKLCFQIKDVPYPGGFLSLVDNRVGVYFPSKNDVKFCAIKEEGKKGVPANSKSNLMTSSAVNPSFGATSHGPIRQHQHHSHSRPYSIEGTMMVDVTEMAVWTIVGTEKQEYSMYLPQVPPSLPEMPQLTSLSISMNGKNSNENTVLSIAGVYFYPGLSVYLADVPCHTEWHSQAHGHVTLPLENVIFRSLFGDSSNDGNEMSLSSHYPHFIVKKDTVIRKDRLVCLEPITENMNWCSPPSLLLPLVLVDTTGVIYETGWNYFLRLDEKVLGNGNIVVVE